MPSVILIIIVILITRLGGDARPASLGNKGEKIGPSASPSGPSASLVHAREHSHKIDVSSAKHRSGKPGRGIEHAKSFVGGVPVSDPDPVLGDSKDNSLAPAHPLTIVIFLVI